jgi:ribulose-phosphate 3-epimerase
LEKVRQLRALIDATGDTIDLQVDGGVNVENAATVVAAGADVLVAGSATFTGGVEKYAANIKALRATPN